MKNNDTFLSGVVATAKDTMGRQIDYIRNYAAVPIGKKQLNPQEFKDKYGISVSMARGIAKKYGPDTTQEVLNALSGGGKNVT